MSSYNKFVKPSVSSEPEIRIRGDRSDAFKNAIIQLLKRSGIRSSSINFLSNDDSMKVYDVAFTHSSFNENSNYEYYELIGDSIVNNCIVLYLKERFPFMCKNPEYVRIISRLKNMLQSKKSFSSIMKELELWTFVSATNTIKNTNQKKISEDIFESFFGATYTLCEEMYGNIGKAFAVVYNIIKKIFDNIQISLRYEDIFDAKSRIKELFDYHKHIGKLEYKNTIVENDVKRQCVQVYRIHNDGRKTLLASHRSSLLIDAQQVASQNALNVLKKQGIFKEIPQAFLNMYKDNEEYKASLVPKKIQTQ
jgi:dsRNA-specific ribonuclease